MLISSLVTSDKSRIDIRKSYSLTGGLGPGMGFSRQWLQLQDSCCSGIT